MPSTQTPTPFPPDFLWGASTSAHQVEGNTHNNWTVWELENAKSLAKQAPYKFDHLLIWPEIKSAAIDPHNYVSAEAADHYHRYEEDFDIATSLHMNAFRFSIEWSRIEPEQGVWSAPEIEHYRNYIKALRARGLEPVVTLYHWTIPVWFADKGGWEHASNVAHFVRFADKVINELGRDINYLITINEPDTVVQQGYLQLNHPPQHHSWPKALWVYRNLLAAHRRVYKLAKRQKPTMQIGFSKTYNHVIAGDTARQTRLAQRLDYLVRDDIVLAYVGRRLDFIGVNHYFTDRYIGRTIANTNQQTSDVGWDMQPENLEHVLVRLAQRHPKLPLIITENGVADSHDAFRAKWIASSLQALQAARARGANVRGYLHWSLLDNFEWAYGRWPRFGLVAVDYATMKRTVRGSALSYGKVIRRFRGL